MPNPRPPSDSGASTPSTPIVASADQARRSTPSVDAPSFDAGVDHAARSTSGGHSRASRSRTASRNASWSSVNAKRTCRPSLGPWQPEHALGDHVALDLVRARVDRSGQRELVALASSPTRRARRRDRAARAPPRGAERRAPTRTPSSSSTRRPAARRRTSASRCGSVCQPVRLGVDPRSHHRVASCGIGGVARARARASTRRSAVAMNRPGLRSVSPRSALVVAIATPHPWCTSPSTAARRARGRRRRTPRRSPRRRRAGRSRAR